MLICRQNKIYVFISNFAGHKNSSMKIVKQIPNALDIAQSYVRVVSIVMVVDARPGNLVWAALVDFCCDDF